MPKVKFSKSDLLATNQLDATWYKLQVRGISEWKPGKTDPTSNNIEADFVVVDGPKAGTPLKHWFSEKAIGTSFDMLAEFTATFTDSGKAEQDKEYDLNSVIGKEVAAYIVFDPERKQNTIKNFRNVNFRPAVGVAKS